MKTHYITLLFVLWYFLFFNGCATTPPTPLKMEVESQKLAEILHIDPSEVKFVSHCMFGQVASTEQYIRDKKEGIVLLTETHLHILKGGSTASATEKIRVPFSDFNGVGLRVQSLWWKKEKLLTTYEIQFRRAAGVIVVQVRSTEWPIYEEAEEEAQKPFSVILAAGVPKWDSEKFFFFRPSEWEHRYSSGGCFLPIPVPMGFPPF